MGVNRAGFAIVDDDGARQAATGVIVRRYFRYGCDHALGIAERETVQRIEVLMEEFNTCPRGPEGGPARARRPQDTVDTDSDRGHHGVSQWRRHRATRRAPTSYGSQLAPHARRGRRDAELRIKALADVPKHLDLISPAVIESVGTLRKDLLGFETISLNLEDTLLALSVSATTNPVAHQAMQKAS